MISELEKKVLNKLYAEYERTGKRTKWRAVEIFKEFGIKDGTYVADLNSSKYLDLVLDATHEALIINDEGIRYMDNKVKAKPGIEKRIKRGTESWNFIRWVFGIFLAVSTFIITLAPFNWLLKLVSFVILLSILFWLFFRNAWFQNKLIGIKIRIEESWRRI